MWGLTTVLAQGQFGECLIQSLLRVVVVGGAEFAA